MGTRELSVWSCTQFRRASFDACTSNNERLLPAHFRPKLPGSRLLQGARCGQSRIDPN